MMVLLYASDFGFLREGHELKLCLYFVSLHSVEFPPFWKHTTCPLHFVLILGHFAGQASVADCYDVERDVFARAGWALLPSLAQLFRRLAHL